MAQQTINVGTSPNDGTGTPLRTAFQYTNSNFSELYTAVGPSGNNIVVPGTATITGDLTVRTDKLFVNATGVGIGNTGPLSVLTVSSQVGARLSVRTSDAIFGTVTGGSGFDSLNDSASALVPFACRGSTITLGTSAGIGFQIDASGNATWQNVGGVAGTAMTLNSTGLGVGVSPSYKLDVSSSSNIVGRVSSSSVLNTGFNIVNTTGSTWSLYSFGSNDVTLQNSFGIYHQNGTSFLQITQAGNVGVGVTPSAWNSSYKAIQTQGGSVVSGTTGHLRIYQNAFQNASNQQIYVTSAAATLYSQDAGQHIWFNAASGTAGNSFSFTQAMTLDASGNLLVGKTAINNTTVGNEIRANGEVFSTQSSSSNAATTYHVFSTAAAAYRFYVGLGGTVYATNTTISAISDARLKENVQDIDVGLGAILALKPRKFDWKAGKGKDIKGDRGFIAQEFETVFPNLIDEWKDNAPEGEAPYKSVRQDLIPVLVKAIQELAAEVNALKNA